MSKLVTPQKCSHCKYKEQKYCLGVKAIQGSILIHCDYFIDKRAKKETKENEEVPYPITKRK